MVFKKLRYHERFFNMSKEYQGTDEMGIKNIDIFFTNQT